MSIKPKAYLELSQISMMEIKAVNYFRKNLFIYFDLVINTLKLLSSFRKTNDLNCIFGYMVKCSFTN